MRTVRVSSASLAGAVVLWLTLGGAVFSTAQEAAEDGGTNQFLAPATKVNYAADKWRNSGEFQVRLDEGYRKLNVWYLEGTATNLTSKHLELAADLRFSVKPDIEEIRPGYGVILKSTQSKWQIPLQSKYQVDIPSEGATGHGLREVLFANFGGVTYIFDPFHTLNVSYFFGWENTGLEWKRSGFLLIQFSLNIRNDWKYVPAKIVNF